MKYHWHWQPEEGPRTIQRPSVRERSPRLFIACTQTGLTSKKQAALVREWCELLPTLDHVTELRLLSRVPQPLFDAACRMPKLIDLYIKWSGIRNLEATRQAKSLRFLHLGSSPSIDSIEPIRAIRNLKWLGLENLARIADLEAINALVDLDGLTLEGTMQTTWKVSTLTPIASLTGLKYLSLANLRSEDRTLASLFGLRNLQTLQTVKWWSATELATVRRNNVNLIA
jgi:hypothetical protein